MLTNIIIILDGKAVPLIEPYTLPGLLHFYPKTEKIYTYETIRGDLLVTKVWEKPQYSTPGPWVEASKATVPRGHYYEIMAPDGTTSRRPVNNGKLRSYGAAMDLDCFCDAVAVRDLGPNPPPEEK